MYSVLFQVLQALKNTYKVNFLTSSVHNLIENTTCELQKYSNIKPWVNVYYKFLPGEGGRDNGNRR